MALLRSLKEKKLTSASLIVLMMANSLKKHAMRCVIDMEATLNMILRRLILKAKKPEVGMVVVSTCILRSLEQACHD